MSLDQIQQVQDDADLNKKILESFYTSMKNIRMEEPSRLLTRLAFDFVRNLYLPPN